MNYVDEHVMKQIYVEVDKATKHLYNDEQLEQIIENLVESRINRHIIDRTHELLLKNIDERIQHELNTVIDEMDIKAVIRHAVITYYYSDEFKERLKCLTKYCDYRDYSKNITLNEIASLYSTDDDYYED